VRQPWASLIAVGLKTIEVRSRPWAYRGPLVICATAGAVTAGLAVVHAHDLLRRLPFLHGHHGVRGLRLDGCPFDLRQPLERDRVARRTAGAVFAVGSGRPGEAVAAGAFQSHRHRRTPLLISMKALTNPSACGPTRALP